MGSSAHGVWPTLEASPKSIQQLFPWDFSSQAVLLLFSKTEADGFKQHLSFLNAGMSDTVKKFTLDPQNNPTRARTISPVSK